MRLRQRPGRRPWLLKRLGDSAAGQVEPLACRARGKPVACRWMVWLA